MDEIKAYTLDEVAELLKVTRRTLYSHIKNGKLKATKIGKYWRVNEESLQQLLGVETPTRTTGQIQFDADNKMHVGNLTMDAGAILEVLIVDPTDNKPKWIETRVEEHDGKYFLAGLNNYQHTGLFARLK